MLVKIPAMQLTCIAPLSIICSSDNNYTDIAGYNIPQKRAPMIIYDTPVITVHCLYMYFCRRQV